MKAAVEYAHLIQQRRECINVAWDTCGLRGGGGTNNLRSNKSWRSGGLSGRTEGVGNAGGEPKVGKARHGRVDVD